MKKKIRKILIISIPCLLFIICIISILINIYQNNKLNNIKLQDENIVFFGDSITKGYNVKEFFNKNKVVNSGVNGNQTIDLLNNIENRLFDYNPSKIFILIGINDISDKKTDNEILENLNKIIKEIKENRKNAKIYIQSIYPVNPNSKDPSHMFKEEQINNKRVTILNKKIKSLCNKENISYINTYDSLVDKNGNLKDTYTVDGVHLTDLGYYKVTMVLNKYINEN